MLMHYIPNMHDVICKLHPNKAIFTHTHQSTTVLIQARIDHMLATDGILSKVTQANTIVAPYLDHRAIKMTIGPVMHKAEGMWKLNTKLLQDQECQVRMRAAMERDLESTKNMPISIRWDSVKEAAKQAGRAHAKEVRKRKATERR